MIAVAILATLVFAGASTFGLRPARAHAAAMALEAAMTEARSLAAASAGATDPLHPTGATVIVERDPTGIDGATRIAVYRSRPIVLGGQTPYPPTPDVGFPPERVAGTFTFGGTGGASIAENFAILLSGSGYASIVALGTRPYDEANPTYWSSDPGCPLENARIAVTDGSASESHAFGCIGGMYAAN